MQQAVGARKELHERAEVRQPHHLAEVCLADLGAGRHFAHHLERGVTAGSARREDVHCAVFQNVNFHPGRFDDGLDLLPARTDQVADLVRRDVQLVEPRRVRRDGRPRRPQRALHDVQDLEPRLLRLRQRLPHHPDADPGHFDVHLQRGNSRPRTGHLEIHVPVVVFRARDVRQDGVPVALAHHQSHRDPGAGRLDRHARIHQRERSAAHRGHRRRSVRFQNVGNEPHRVRKICIGRQQVHERAFRQRAVTNLPPPRPPQKFHLAYAERREVVVQHEPLERVLLKEQIQPLHVLLRPQRQRCQRLRLAAGKQRRAVHARQQAHFARDRPDLVELSPVRSPPQLQGVVAEVLLAQPPEGAQRERPFLFFFLRDRLFDLVLQRIHQVVALLLRIFLRVQRVVQPLAVFLLDLFVQRFVKWQRLDHDFLWIHLPVQFPDRRHDALDLRMAEFQRIGHRLFRNLQRARLHHHDGVLAPGNHDVQQAGLLLRHRRVRHELPVQQPHAHRRDRIVKRQVRAERRGRRAGHGNDVRVVLAVGGEHHGHDLCLVPPRLGKERPQRPVDQPRHQNLALRRPPFALEESPGNFSRGIGVLAVVHRQRQKVALIQGRRHAGRHQQHRIPIARHNGAICLLCNLAGFERQGTSPDFHRYDVGRRHLSHWIQLIRHFSLSFCPATRGAYSCGSAMLLQVSERRGGEAPTDRQRE